MPGGAGPSALAFLGEDQQRAGVDEPRDIGSHLGGAGASVSRLARAPRRSRVPRPERRVARQEKLHRLQIPRAQLRAGLLPEGPVASRGPAPYRGDVRQGSGERSRIGLGCGPEEPSYTIFVTRLRGFGESRGGGKRDG